MLAICSAASIAMARFSLAGMWKPPSSSRVAPSPMPKSTRPLETMSSVRQALGGARRVIVVGDHLADAVADADGRGQGGAQAARNTSGAEEWEYSSRKWCSTSQA